MINYEVVYYAELSSSFSGVSHFSSDFVSVQRCDKKHMESDAPIALYYERLASVQSRGCQVTHQVLKDILREVQLTLVPEILLKEWAQYTYQDPSDYWTFRKQVHKRCFLLRLSRSLRLLRAYTRSAAGTYDFHSRPPLSEFSVSLSFMLLISWIKQFPCNLTELVTDFTSFYPHNKKSSFLPSFPFNWLCRVSLSSPYTSQDWGRKCFKSRRTRADLPSPIVALKWMTPKVRLLS